MTRLSIRSRLRRAKEAAEGLGLPLQAVTIGDIRLEFATGPKIVSDSDRKREAIRRAREDARNRAAKR